MNKGHSLKGNLVLQTCYQILETCLPLITAPYLARVLGAEKLGVFSYTSSVVAYFTLFAMLGTANYGTKCIAAVNNKNDRSKTFWEIYFFQIIVCMIALIAYIIYLVFACKDNKIIATIQIITIISCFANINWLFFGMEMFKITVTRNAFIRILTVVCILVFVKNPEDLGKYTFIMMSSTFFSQIILIWLSKKYIVFILPSVKNIFMHIKPNLLLFIPLLAMSVYHTMDKTMLGILSNYEQSGYYYNADKIINIPIGIISGISTVMLPRMTSLINNGRKTDADKLFCMSMEGTVLAGSAVAFGIAAIANEFEPLFFGNGYEPCIILTVVLAPVLIIKSFSFTARYQYLIPNNHEKDFTLSVIIGAIVNLIFNYILIPIYGAMGAVIGTLLAELSACVWQFYVIRKYISLMKTIIHCLMYMLIGTIMLILVRLIANMLTLNIVLVIFLEILIGILSYCILCIIYWKITDNHLAVEMFGNFSVFGKLIKKML